MTGLLEIRGLDASYGSGAVVVDISLDVALSDVVGIVGPNGHGKTSVLRSISGLMPRCSGEIRFMGDRIDRLQPDAIARRGIAHVPQGDLVYKQMTIRENLLVGGYANATRAATRSRLDHVFELFPKLAERMDQTASTLSGGERRMLGIGRGLMMAGVRLLMLDEPSLGLAPVVVEQIYGAIAGMKSAGISIIVVEENWERAATLADDVHLISTGRIVWRGRPSEVSGSQSFLETYLGARDTR